MKRFSRNRRHWIAVAIVTIAFGLPLLLPWLVQQTAISWLHGQGMESATIDDIDINLFTGKLDIKGLDAGEGLKCRRLTLHINWLPLLSRTLHIRFLRLSGADIRLQQAAGKSGFMLGPLPLPQDTAAGNRSDTTPSDPWNIVLQHVTIEDVTMAAETGTGAFRARLVLFNLLGTPAEDGINQSLQSEINLDQIALQTGDRSVSVDDLYLAGEIALPPLEKIATADIGHGQLRLEGALLKTAQGDSLTLQALRMDSVEISDFRRLAIGQIIMRACRAKHGAITLADLGRGTISTLEVDESLLPRLQRIELNGIGLSTDDRHSLGRIATLKAGPIVLASASELNIGSIGIAGLDLSLLRDDRGMAVISALAAAPAAATAKSGAERTQKKRALTLRVDSIELADGSRLALRDETISPVLRLKLESRGVAIDGLDSSGNSRGRFRAAFVLDDDGSLQADGSFLLKQDAPDLDMHMALLRFDISALSGYLEKGFGHAVQTGQLDVDSNIAIAGGALKAENSLTIRRLSVKKSDIPGNAIQKLGMPLDTALDMLRDDRGDIALKVPLSGRLDDLKIDLSDAINQALASAMGSAALSYASLLLQPYGSILPALSYTSDLIAAARKPRLTPVTFAPGSPQLSGDAAGYAAKLAELLDKKPLRLELCGIAHRSEAAAAAPLNDEALLQLASERARALKAAITAHGIAPERLFNCRPAIDEKSELPGRVELLLD